MSLPVPTMYVTRVHTRYATRFITRGVVTKYYRLEPIVDDKGVTHMVTRVVAVHTEVYGSRGRPTAVSTVELERVLKRIITT